jgi:very-short-patch-repair endonuclease
MKVNSSVPPLPVGLRQGEGTCVGRRSFPASPRLCRGEVATRSVAGEGPQLPHARCRQSSMLIALTRRRALRQRATNAEKVLWDLLRARQFVGLKFRRQHSVGPYIVDFYCAASRVAVELDGGQHFTMEGQVYDERRSAYLASHGIRVLRFSNRELFEELNGVLELLRRACGT